jgi:hypothetical protein
MVTRIRSAALTLLMGFSFHAHSQEAKKAVPKKPAPAKADPARIRANEAAAIAACKTYAEAQDIYRRTDWDSDGVLEYSQAVSGDNSLYEKNAGKGDITLVDAAFAAAAGMPVALKDKDVPKADEKTRKAVAKLIPKLGAEEYQTRQDASEAIKALGGKAIQPLEEALKLARDPEVATRCRALAARLRKDLMMKLWSTTRTARPKRGYCFKILKGQGPNAPGGRKSYVHGGNMTLGYGLLAFPATYGVSGRRTFIINNTGTVYGKDLGPKTREIAEKATEYNPDQSYRVAE